MHKSAHKSHKRAEIAQSKLTAFSPMKILSLLEKVTKVI